MDALIAAAGELATNFGVTGWPDGAAGSAAAVCFEAWLNRRGGTGAAEIKDGIAQIRKFLEAHGIARFEPINTDDQNTDQRTINRAGFRRENDAGNWEYLVLPETYRTELCKGLDTSAINRGLLEYGLLIPDTTDGKATSRHRLPGMGVKRVYHIAAAIMGDSDV